MCQWNGRILSRINRKPEDYTHPFADADYTPCISMDVVKLNVQWSCHEILRTFSSIGDPIVVHLSRSGKPHGRRLANNTTTSFADEDYWTCNLVAIGQLIQQSNCCTLLLAISSIGDPLGVNLERPETTAFC